MRIKQVISRSLSCTQVTLPQGDTSHDTVSPAIVDCDQTHITK